MSDSDSDTDQEATETPDKGVVKVDNLDEESKKQDVGHKEQHQDQEQYQDQEQLSQQKAEKWPQLLAAVASMTYK